MNRALRTGLFIVINLLLFRTSWAEPYLHAATGIVFPDRVAGLERHHMVTDYETSTPGLGVSVAYNGPDIVVTVYLYTMGLSEVPADVNDPVFRGTFRSAADEIAKLNEYGYYSGLTTLFEGNVPLSNAGTGRQVLHGHYRYFKVQDGVDCQSHLYLTNYRNHFFKVRYTYDIVAGEYGEITMKSFLKEFDHMLGNETGH